MHVWVHPERAFFLYKLTKMKEFFHKNEKSCREICKFFSRKTR